MVLNVLWTNENLIEKAYKFANKIVSKNHFYSTVSVFAKSSNTWLHIIPEYKDLWSVWYLINEIIEFSLTLLANMRQRRMVIVSWLWQKKIIYNKSGLAGCCKKNLKKKIKETFEKSMNELIYLYCKKDFIHWIIKIRKIYFVNCSI